MESDFEIKKRELESEIKELQIKLKNKEDEVSRLLDKNKKLNNVNQALLKDMDQD
jgi:hypothetical protein